MSWATRDGPEDSGDDSDEEAGSDQEWGAGGGGTLNTVYRSGGKKARGGNTAANDWFAATRHGRDDAVSGGVQFSFSKGPGWEDTFAFKRSTARRAIQTSRIMAGKVSWQTNQAITARTEDVRKYRLGVGNIAKRAI